MDCKVKKPLSEFPTTNGYHRKQCKPCYVARVHKLQTTAAGRVKNIANWNRHFQKNPERVRFTMSKATARQGGHAWDLTEAQYVELNRKPCHYCGGPLPPKGRGLDRLDNARGYSIDNIVPCCTACNRMRGDHLTYDEMVAVSKALRRFRAGSNPKAITGAVKVSVSKLPPAGVIHGALAMMDGAEKYTPYNFRDVKISATVYVDALLRHVLAYFDGEDLAPDSRAHHLGHAIACAAIILDAQERGNLIDDRPTTGPSAALLARLSAELLARAAEKARLR